MATDRMHPYGELDTAIGTCYKQHKRTRLPISISLDAQAPNTSD